MRAQVTLAVLLLLSLGSFFAPSTAEAQQTVLVVPIRGPGAEEAALQAATTSVRRRLEARGYSVRLYEGSPPALDVTPAQLGELASTAGADLVVDGTLQDFAGMPSIQIRVVSADGTVQGEDANLARGETLPQDAALVLANALQTLPPPPPGGASATGDVDSPFGGGGEGSQATEPIPQVRPQPVRRPPRRRRRPEFPDRHFWIGALVEPAMGTNRSSFNLLTGLRAEYQWRGLTVGAALSYAFIKDWEPRSDPNYHTMSVFGMIGYKIRLGSDRLSLPLLAGGGYIPGNGGLLRFEAGLSIRPIDRLEVRLIFVCPNFWFLDEEMVLFTSISFGLHFGI